MTVRLRVSSSAGQKDQTDADLPRQHRAQLCGDPAGHRLAATDRQLQGRDTRRLERGGRLHYRPGSEQRGRPTNVPQRLQKWSNPISAPPRQAQQVTETLRRCRTAPHRNLRGVVCRYFSLLYATPFFRAGLSSLKFANISVSSMPSYKL